MTCNQNSFLSILDNGRGDVCDNDADGDGINDKDDVCPENAEIHSTDFRSYQTIVLDPEGESQTDPHWAIWNEVGLAYLILIKTLPKNSNEINFACRLLHISM